MSTQTPRFDPLWLLPLGLAVGLGLRFVQLTMLPDASQPTWVLVDDAMVSMRYARNLAEGYGLVWNPGGPAVEGFTNPAWTLLMALVHWLGAADHTASLWVQLAGVVAFAVQVLLVGFLGRALGLDRRTQLIAMLGVAVYHPAAQWAWGGLEVGAVAAAALGVQVAWLRGWVRVSFLFAGLAAWLRPDATLIVLPLLVGTLAVRTSGWAMHLAQGFCLFIAPLVLQLLWRWTVFGELVPNTALLKLGGFPLGPRVAAGLERVGDFASSIGAGVWVLGGLGAWTLRDRPLALLPLTMLLVQLAYSVWIGGDAWEHLGGSNRFVSVGTPFLWLFCAIGARQVARWTAPRLGHVGAWVVVGGLGLAVAARANHTGATLGLRHAAGLVPPPHRASAERLVSQAARLRASTKPQARVAVVWAGTLPYFARRPAIDLLGKTDPVIARTPMHIVTPAEGLPLFFPGHLKWDYAHSIGELQPDVITQLWTLPGAAAATWQGVVPSDAAPFITAGYRAARSADFVWHIRADSENVDWEALSAAANIAPPAN